MGDLYQITARQIVLLKAIQRFIDTDGYAPSQRDMAREIHCNNTTIQKLMNALEKHGVITHVPGIGRSWRILRPELGSVHRKATA